MLHLGVCVNYFLNCLGDPLVNLQLVKNDQFLPQTSHLDATIIYCWSDLVIGLLLQLPP